MACRIAYKGHRVLAQASVVNVTAQPSMLMFNEMSQMQEMNETQEKNKQKQKKN